MADLKHPSVSLSDVSLSLGDWLISLRRQGRLQPLLSEAVIEQFLSPGEPSKRVGVELSRFPAIRLLGVDEVAVVATTEKVGSNSAGAAAQRAWQSVQSLGLTNFGPRTNVYIPYISWTSID